MKTPRPPWLLVLAVLVAHLLLGEQVQRIEDGWAHDGPAPMRRLQVDFVQAMVLRAPPVARAEAPATSPPRSKPRAAAAGAAPASAPASGPDPVPAPAPDPGPEPSTVPPAPPVVAPAATASAPVDTATPAPPAPAPAPAEGEPGPEWPLSTRLSYVLTGNYRGPVQGQAQVEWLRKGRDYQVHLDVGVGPSFAPLISRRMSSQGLLTPEGIAPQRYEQDTRFLLGPVARVAVQFAGAEAQLANGARQPLGRGAQDAASQFVQLTWLYLTGREPLQPGRLVQFPLVLPYRQYGWAYELLGEETLDTPMGALAAWHLRPTRPPANGDLVAEVWLAPALQFLPVRLIIRQDAENYVDLMLRSAPLQAAPESANDTPRRLSP